MTTPVANTINTQSTGSTSTGPFINVVLARDPTPYDLNYKVQQRWINSSTQQEFYLLNFTTSQGVTLANWVELSSGSLGVDTLQGNVGGKVGPDNTGNIMVVGDGTTINVVGSPSTNTLIISAISFSFSWIDASGDFTASIGQGYFITGTSIVTLPASPSQSDLIGILFDNASGNVTIQANTGQSIRLANVSSSVAGTFVNTQRGDSLYLVYRDADSSWISIFSTGSWTAS